MTDATRTEGEGGGGQRTRSRIGLALLVAVLTVEIGVRLLGVLPASLRKPIEDRGFTPAKLTPELARLVEETPLVRHPYLAYSLRPGFHAETPQQRSINAWGFRGPEVALDKPDDVFRIVCLGGSSTYGHTPSSDATTWPARLEYWLNQPDAASPKRVEVLNGGCSGWSTFESTVNLAFRMVEFQPDLVVVYHSINDMRCALYEPGGPIRMDNTQWREVFPRVVTAPGEKLLEHSMTYAVLRQVFTDYVKRFDSLNTALIVNYDPKAKNLYTLEPVERGFRNFRRNLVSIDALAHAHGADVLMLTQGCDERDIGSESRASQIAALHRMGDIVTEVAAERGAHFLDAKTEMESKAAADGWDRYFTLEVHLTDEGADLLARLVARKLIQEHLVR